MPWAHEPAPSLPGAWSGFYSQDGAVAAIPFSAVLIDSAPWITGTVWSGTFLMVRDGKQTAAASLSASVQV